jgi:hypothetical protein
VQLVRELARILPDHSIAPLLNRLGIRSAKGQSWTQLRVRNFRGVPGMATASSSSSNGRGQRGPHQEFAGDPQRGLGRQRIRLFDQEDADKRFSCPRREPAG